jgi:hypothetical protein
MRRTVVLGPSFIFGDPPLFTIEANKPPIFNLVASYAMGDPLRLFHLTMGNPISSPRYTDHNKNQTYRHRQNL